ncbi:short-chain dehydrogenase/reductase SDR [Alcanivorax xiamenensis]|uniref:Short-chain dehydrogenase/reductase SDR n=1 Tax=Alcanivorax xiamenensis TaxID=1177156 RepID=A0ABQ6YAA8_9GAMM|nr:MULTISPECIES: SDR family oxidoreductase [Alcanivorax]KAF0806570.1 short-chain dehydrogenase/reductase SDR [Alcanivorax xiamenensis]
MTDNNETLVIHPHGKLKKKVALITGSGRGIGRAIALKLASEGARVVVNDLDPDTGDAVAAEIAEAGGDAIAINGSVTEEAFPERFVQGALEAFGGIDIIVNNAGYTWDATIGKMTDDMFQAMLDVHLVAPFRILRAASEPIRIMAKKEASEGHEVFRKVVNISSIAGLYGNAGQASYSSGKASLLGLTRTLCKEWGRYKVNVNAVAFGLIETRLTQAIEEEQKTIEVEGRAIKVGVQPSLLDTMARTIPLGRAGHPQEAADAVYLFCAPESNYISGQMLVCGGGLLM